LQILGSPLEILLLVILLCSVIIVFFVGRSGKSGEERASETPSTPQGAECPHSNKNAAGTDAFDSGSAKHLDRTRVLTGPAYVTDGDTIRIKKTQIRLFGIDAPEMNHPYGKKAKWALHKLCKDQAVRAEITDEDDHGRAVARCYLPDGRDLSAEMVKQGLAIDWPKFSDGKYRHLEQAGHRKKIFLADARQKGRKHVWESYDARQNKS
jgi:endonuclease YncB( thermonuclease family)